MIRWIPAAAMLVMAALAALRGSPYLSELNFIPSGVGRWLDAHGTTRHLLGYSLLAFASGWAAWWRRPGARRWPVPVALSLVAAALEVAQLFLPNRHADLRDVAMSWAGIVIGVAAAWIVIGRQKWGLVMAGRGGLALLAVMLVGVFALWQWNRAEQRLPAPGAWGIDAVITRHVNRHSFREYLAELRRSGVGIVRERDVGRLSGTIAAPGPWRGDVRAKFKIMQRGGLRVVAFAHLPLRVKPEQPGNQLPEDLLMVFEQGRFLGREFAGLVDAWETVGEPDIGYCTDLPDRVAAYQKALYLGIKAGAAEDPPTPKGFGEASGGRRTEDRRSNSDHRSQFSGFPQSPLVLMGALGMPPSPWLERAARNGLLDYTDAYNFHFYGHASDLTGVIESHRAFLRRHAREMPLWITECGIEAVTKSDPHDLSGRRVQADFILATARQALAAHDVAVFMPFILAHRGDPYAMTASARQPFPAWTEYAQFTRENPWPARPLARAAHNPSPVVVQWLPDNRTTTPRKTGGTYRFNQDGPIKGEIRIYNFSDKLAAGRLLLRAGNGQTRPINAEDAERTERVDETVFTVNSAVSVFIDTPRELTIQPMGMVAVPVEIRSKSGRYFREWIEAGFEEANPGPGARSQQSSKVFFGVEQPSRPEDLIEEPLGLHLLERIRFPQMEPYQVSGQSGAWTCINGLRVAAGKAESQKLTAESSIFWIDAVDDDPLKPTMAAAGLAGLPASGFIRVRLDKPMTPRRKILLTIVDDRGQRYSVWENFSADYYGSRQDILINLEDLHLDFWGRAGVAYKFEPARTRELHLRLYLSDVDDRLGVRLSLLRPGRDWE